MRWFLLAVFTACVAGLILIVISRAQAAGSFDGFGGRWKGTGTITMTDSNTEELKCVATYFLSEGGTGLKIHVRCASSGYKIDAKGTLKSRDGKVSGEFEERNYEKRGTVSGTVGDGKIAVAISGTDWRARLVVAEHGGLVMFAPDDSVVKVVTMIFHKD